MSENMRTYETICLTKVDMPEELFSGMVEKIKGAIAKEGKGELLMHDDWGKAKIAYPIDREPRAQWTYFRYSAEPAVIESINHQLKINEFVLRQLTCKCDVDGADYNPVRSTMPKDIVERFNRFDDRPRRKGGGRGRDSRFRSERPSYGDRDNRNNSDSGDVVAPTTPKSSAGEKS